MRKSVCVLAIAAALFTRNASAQTPGALLGIYYGNQGWDMGQVRAMESWQQRSHAVVVLFTNWNSSTQTLNNLFNQQLPNVWNNRNVPLVTWEPFTGNRTPVDIVQQINQGKYDAYVLKWATAMKRFLAGPDGVFGTVDDRRAYLRLAHEMNGDWYPWGGAGSSTPADYVAMWLRVHQVFDSVGIDATHLQWVWSVNADDVGRYRAEQFYPGTEWVDWIAIDGYNWAASQSWSDFESPGTVFELMRMRLRAISDEPLALTETASTSQVIGGASLAAKSQWVSELASYVFANDVRMLCWFNEDKEADWAVFGGTSGDGTFKAGRTTYKTLSAYRAAVSVPGFVSSTLIQRLLTDDQFAGR